MDRRELLKGGLAVGGLIGLGGCGTGAKLASAGTTATLGYDPVLPIMPVRAHVDRIYDIKCCIRPFRAAGPRLDVEQVGDATVIHNYGHGGSGWSLSWGSAAIVVEKAMASLPAEVAVIGCGIIGLSTALTAQRAGAKVTIYTRDLLPRTRSVRANGSWTPDSRISLKEPAGPGFASLWEQMARTSYKTFKSYMGLPGRPVDFSDSYALSDEPPKNPHEDVPDAQGTGGAPIDSYATKGVPVRDSEFGHYEDRIADIEDKAEDLPEGSTPFPVKYVRRASRMFYNFGSYGDLLMRQFHEAGGRIVIREFHSTAELGTLPQKTVINCPGYAARDWMADKSIIPVRGQTAWLIPQPEVNYGLYYKGASMLSKSDGIMVQGVGGGEIAWVGNSNEVVNRDESIAAIKVLEDLFARMSFPSYRQG